MTSNTNFNSRLSQLEKFDNSKDYLMIVNTLTPDFDSGTNDIINKWISNNTLSNDEIKYIDLYSNIQLAFVKHCFFNSNTTADVQTMIDKFRMRLFQVTQTDTLARAVEFIREEQSSSNNGANQDDLILVYIMRMIDARSLAYRLYFQNLKPPPKKLDDELKPCLFHRHGKKYLYDVKSTDEINKNTFITDLHKFFIGCCTFAVALYEENKDMLTDNERNNKYICLLAKYIRIMLNKKDFAKNESILYCIRGIFALLTNCVPNEYWLKIINQALKNPTDDDAQQKNPFNLDLFSLIINQLLASNILQKKTEESSSNEETLLVDAVLVFLYKWSDTQTDDDDDDEEDNNNNSSPCDESNELLHCFRSNKQFEHTSEIIIPYTDAKYDRIRLMALSILSNIMNQQDFENLKNRKPNMAKDLLKVIFDFINQAVKQEKHKYKGITFDALLRCLLRSRFLVQDSVKEEVLPYVSQLVGYAKHNNAYALKILRKISTNPDLQEDLLKNVHLKQFIETDANIYEVNPRMYKIVKQLRQNLSPFPIPTGPLPRDSSNNCQVFISYCHRDKDRCKSIEQQLRDEKIFTNIWVDERQMQGDIEQTIVNAISQSKVVLVLLSDEYCRSDVCRREWTYAMKKNIKVYVIIVQENFDKEKYGWVEFRIENEFYYKIHKNDDFPKLIAHLRENLNKKLEQVQNRRKSINATRRLSLPPPPTTRPEVSTGNHEYSQKKSIATWTSEDIQNWCKDNYLEKWRKPLINFDGENLLVLRRDLSNDGRIQYIGKENPLDIFDIARFKSEIDKILPVTTKKYKPSMKKQVIKRRTSKASNK